MKAGQLSAVAAGVLLHLLAGGAARAAAPGAPGNGRTATAPRERAAPGYSESLRLAEEEASASTDPGASLEIEEDLRSRVVMAAAKREQTVPNAPGVVEVITAEDIAQAGYRSVGEALMPLAGIVVYDDYVHYNVGVRGTFGGERSGSRIVKVLIDGQPIAYRSSSVNFLGPEMLPIELVERIEIIRGPGSVLYGANAFLGGINVVTKGASAFVPSEAFKAAQGAGLLVRGGPIQGQASPALSGAAKSTGPGLGGFGAFAAGAQSGDIEVVAGAVRQREDRSGIALPASSPRYSTERTAGTGVTYGQDPYSRGDVAQPASAYGRVSYASPAVGRLRVFGCAQQLNSQGEFQDRNTLSHDNAVALSNLMGRADLERRLGSAAVLRVFGAYATGGPSDRYSVRGAEKGTALRLDAGYRAVDTGVEIAASAGRWLQLLLGADFSWDEEKRPVAQQIYLWDTAEQKKGTVLIASGTPGTIPFRNGGVYGLATLTPFAEFEGSLVRDLGLTAGVRYEANSVYGSSVNWRGGIVLPLGEQWYIKALGGSSFKGPSAEELYAIPLLPGDPAGNADLKPQTALTAEGVVGFNPSRYVAASVVAYYNDVRDQIRYQHSSTSVASMAAQIPENLTRQQTQGVELQVRAIKPVARWTLGGFANASLLDTTAERPAGTSGAVASVKPDLYPHFTANFGLSVRYRPSALGLYLEGRLLGSRPPSRDNEDYWAPHLSPPGFVYELPPVFTLDAALSTDPIALGASMRVRALARVTNLFNVQYALPGFYGFDIPGRPRTFSGLLEMAF